MTYRVEIEDSAAADLARLDKTVAQQVIDKLNWLSDNAAAVRHKALKHQWTGVSSLHVGNYRALYNLCREECLIVVLFVKHRREIYDTG